MAGMQDKAIQGWSTQRKKRPLPWVKSIRNKKYSKDEDRRGEWQPKVDSEWDAKQREELQTWDGSGQ